jgi:HEAT repeat protein
LREVLKAPHARAVVAAARLAAERGWAELAPDVAAAFGRLLTQPAKVDPGCLAKVALVETLNEFEYGSEALFLRGLHHVQKEPVWGETIDTAGNLRGTCAGALVRTGYPDIRYELASLLSDPQPEARCAAARAFALVPGEASEVALRVKANAGDAAPDVVAACFSGLMALDPERSLDFVAKFIDSDDPVTAEDAALAVGESRLPMACALLIAQWEKAFHAKRRRMLALPLALTRTEEGFEFLLEALERERSETALAVLEALTVYRDDPARRTRIEDVVQRGETALITAFLRLFDEDPA